MLVAYLVVIDSSSYLLDPVSKDQLDLAIAEQQLLGTQHEGSMMEICEVVKPVPLGGSFRLVQSVLVLFAGVVDLIGVVTEEEASSVFLFLEAVEQEVLQAPLEGCSTCPNDSFLQTF